MGYQLGHGLFLMSSEKLVGFMQTNTSASLFLRIVIAYQS